MDFGICHLAYLPLRKENRHQSENVSQLLFGESFRILDRDADWCRIKLDFDQYEGWIAAPELMGISEEMHDKIIKSREVYTGKPFTGLDSPDVGVVGVGSNLPLYKNGQFVVGNRVYKIDREAVFQKPDSFSIQSGLDLIGTPYLWGGRSSFGIDCSGLSQLVYKLNGIRLPRDAYQQATVGEEIDFEQRKKYDLAFFKNEKGRIHHVGVLISRDKILHASVKVRQDILKREGIWVDDKQAYSHRLAFIRRILK